ncbi:MAG: PAS domain S-box protein [Desulfovibrionales bacterium]|nr:PAS domain S-box protein [Desulfovibrionales bacterium]
MNLAQYYNTVIDLSHGVVVTLDETGRIIHGNSLFEQVSGYQLQELAGQNWFSTFVLPQHQDASRAAFADIVAQDRLCTTKSSLVDRSGRRIFVNWNVQPMRTSSGDLLCVLCVGVDVTEHIERQQVLRHEHARLVAMNKELSCLHAMNRLVADMESTLPDLLQQILTIIPPAFQFPEATGVCLTLDGQRIIEGPYNQDAACRMKEEVLAHTVKRGHLHVSLTGCTDNGLPRTFLATERELLGALAKHVGGIIARRETLSTKRNLERQLQHADRLAKIGQLAAGVAHELNEPLANILGFAQLACQAPDLPRQVAHDVERIIKSALHSREIIKKLMFFSRQVPLQKTLVDLNQIVRDSVYFTEMSSSRAKAEVRLELDSALPPIMGDPQHLKQVVVNIVINAIHAMPHGGHVCVQTASFKDDVYLVVEDTGVGMSPEVLRQIFTPFFTTKDVDQGTGLGLAVVHGIIAAHGGVIDVQSTPGQGTRMEIVFPCQATAPGQDA